MYRNAIFSFGIIFIVFIGLAQFATAQRADRVANTDEVRILSLINRERSHKGLSDLGWNDELGIRRFEDKVAASG